MQNRNQQNNVYEIKITDESDKNISEEKQVNNEERKENTADQVEEQRPKETTEDISYLHQLQRLQAEFSNYKKRIEKERAELSDFYKSELVGSLLPVLDDFDRMLDHTNDDENNEFLMGIKLIYQKLLDILQEQGLKPIDAVGTKFDPQLHEALLIEQSEDGEDDLVVEEWRKGYLFNDRLLRPAQVKVQKTEK